MSFFFRKINASPPFSIAVVFDVFFFYVKKTEYRLLKKTCAGLPFPSEKCPPPSLFPGG